MPKEKKINVENELLNPNPLLDNSDETPLLIKQEEQKEQKEQKEFYIPEAKISDEKSRSREENRIKDQLIKLYETKAKPQLDKLPVFQGSRQMRDSTLAMNLVLWQVLDINSDIKFSYESSNQFARWKDDKMDYKVNMTELYKKRIDFEQIKLFKQHYKTALLLFNEYNSDLENKWQFQPDTNLHFEEQMAIHLYSRNWYLLINDNLRKNGDHSVNFLKNSTIITRDNPEFQKKMKYIVALENLAAIAVNKKRKPNEQETEKMCFRQMRLSELDPYFKRLRDAASKGNLLIEESFTSSSIFEMKGTFSGLKDKPLNFFQLIIGTAPDIMDLSLYPNEYERLYPPHKYFRHLAFEIIDGQYFLISKEECGILPERDREDNVSYDPIYLKKLKQFQSKETVENPFSFFTSLKAAGASISSTLEKAKNSLQLCCQCEP